jgi:hypothetical protein
MNNSQRLGVSIKAASLQQMVDLMHHFPRQHVDPSTAAGEALKMPFLGGANYLQSQTGQGEGSGLAQSGVGGALGGLLGHGLTAGLSKSPVGKIRNIAAILGGSYLGQAGGAYHAAVDSNEAGNAEASSFLQGLDKLKPTPLLKALARRLAIKGSVPIKVPAKNPGPQNPSPAKIAPSGNFTPGGGSSGGGGAGAGW